MIPRRSPAQARLLSVALTCAAAVALITTPAWGTVGPPVKIRMPANTKQAESGKEYHGVFEIDLGQPGVIGEIHVNGRGWRVHAVERPAAPQAVAAGRLRIPFRATPANADDPVELTLTFDGQRVSRAYRIGPKAFAERGKDRRAAQDGQAAVAPLPRQNPTEIAPTGGAVSLRFVGRIVYDRPVAVDANGMGTGGTTEEGVDGIWVEVMDEDSIDSETIWSGSTDPNGYFDTGAISWDDCDISGCDEPDIYVRFECDTGVINVQDAEDIFEPDYSWSNIDNVVDDFTGSFHNFGTLKPADSAQMPALHIHTSITRAWRFILNKSGTGISVTELDLLWPDSGGNAFYDPSDHEIHISTFRQWNEGTHTHEYGHHFLETYSVNTPPEYCNGFCDTAPDNCGHCVWCQETDHDAWNEGWPNWLADVVTRDYPLTYQFSNGQPWTALIPRSQESLGLCGMGDPHDPLRTEGFAGALLGDIEDAAQDDHDGDATFDCDVDAMALGPEEIFTVVVQDKPATPAQFIQMFRDRFPEHDQDFWSTTRNVALAYGFPLPVPQVSTVSQGCSSYRAGERIELTISSNGSLLQFQWRRNSVNLSNGGRISGVNTRTLVIDPSQADDGGMYNCLVSTCDGTYSVPSTQIRVHVFAAPSTGLAALGFGRNHAGQTGRGTACSNSATCAATPEPVINLANFADIAAFEWHTVGVLTDGSVWGWGSNSYAAAVGRVTQTTYLLTPELVPEVTNAVTASVGDLHSVVLRGDGKVFAWGYNGYGALGVANPNQYQPIEMPGIECMVAAEAGYHHTLLLGSNGTMWACGYNAEGQLGRGFTSGWETSPAPVGGLSDVVAIAAGGLHNLALKSDGTVWAWGWNSQGQLGDGTLDRRTSPYQVPGIASATAVAASFDHSMALLADGSVRVWGGGGGKMGDGTPNRSLVPITPIGMTSNVTAISGGYYHSLFLRSDRTVWGCGYNYNGQLGQQTQVSLYTPAQITGLSDVRGLFGWGETTFVSMPGVAPAFPFVLGSQSAKVGGAVIWTSPANGTPTITYQWKHGNTVLVNGGPISGATTSTLMINPVLLAHAGTYTCTATNGYGSVNHSDTLTVTCIDADFNCDEHVDVDDVQVMADCETGPSIPGPPPGCTAQQFAAADYDNDGDVDMDDYGRFQRCIAGPGQIPPATCGQ